MKWSKLPKKDKKHLTENKIRYKWQFQEQVDFLKKQYEIFHKDSTAFVCWDCIRIAKKLGMWK